MVALENRLGWPGEGRTRPPLPLNCAPPRCGRQNANTKPFLQLLMKFGDIVRVKTSCTIFNKDHNTAEEGYREVCQK